MDLLDAVESGRFLGREFLIFLWFESEVLEGQFEMPDGERFELWLENQLTLESEAAEQEITRMRGAAPSATSEAHEALRRGKLPIQARIRIDRGQQAFGGVINAKTLNVSSALLPQLIKEEEEERFYERMYLIEELEKMVDALYERFLSVRLSPVWETKVLPMIRRWVVDPSQVDVKKYRAARDEATPLGGAKKAGWVIEGGEIE
jgi:hypothetical protein